jgi:hypothetical protein
MTPVAAAVARRPTMTTIAAAMARRPTMTIMTAAVARCPTTTVTTAVSGIPAAPVVILHIVMVVLHDDDDDDDDFHRGRCGRGGLLSPFGDDGHCLHTTHCHDGRRRNTTTRRTV